MFLIIAGAVIGMGVAWIGLSPSALSIGMIVVALVCVAAGLALNRKYRAKDDA